MQSKCEKRQGGNVAVGWGKEKKKSRCCKKKKKVFKEKDGLENPGEGAVGALLRQKCDRAPPGPGKTLRTNEQQDIFSLSSFICPSFSHPLLFVLRCKDAGW